MAKLKLRKACYEGIKNTKPGKPIKHPEHKKLIDEHTQKMESYRNRMIDNYDDIKNISYN